jgi:hypothetical protein
MVEISLDMGANERPYCILNNEEPVMSIIFAESAASKEKGHRGYAHQLTVANDAVDGKCLEPLPAGVKAKPNTPKMLRKDLRTLALFVRVYCQAKHRGQMRVEFKGFDARAITGKDLELCRDCSRLLQHAWVKRTHCPRDPKPQCKDCPTHCYSKVYREKIREVMRFSGMRLFLTGRLDYLFHLFF